MPAQILVKDKMHKNVITASPDDEVRKTVKTMADHNIGCIVICENGKPCGILTERDIMKRIVAPGTDPNFAKVREVMTKKLVDLDSGKSVQEAVDILDKNGIKRLPVIDSGKLVGVITMTDLLRALREIEDNESREISKRVKDLHLTKIKLQSRIISLEDKINKAKAQS